MNALGTVMYFADALARERSLTNEEIDRLCSIKRLEGPSIIRKWLLSDDVELGKLLHQGKTAVQIGEMIGRTPNAVRCRVRELKRMGRT